jgi:hypothetical protein
VVTWAGLAVVAVSAAVLSFATVRDLALDSGYPSALAWLLPVVIDATAVVGSRIWLGGGGHQVALRYARVLALSAAAVTIAANVLQHGLAAHRLAPPWWLVAVLAAIPPTALVAVAHQVALLARPQAVPDPDRAVTPEHVDAHDADAGEELATDPQLAAEELATLQAEADAYDADLRAKALRFLAEADGPVGRRRLAEGLGVSDWTARRLLTEITDITDSACAATQPDAGADSTTTHLRS